jgi:tRNA(Ile2) C34 agmatinyltransferase TiaS
MGERWFSDEELQEMARPTMDRAIEALDRGDVETARALCEAMKHEWRSLHDLMVEGIAGLISFVQEKLGDDGVADAWRYGNERGTITAVPTIGNAR